MKYAYVYPSGRMCQILSEQYGAPVYHGERVPVLEHFVREMWDMCGKFYKLQNRYEGGVAQLVDESGHYWNMDSTWFEVVEIQTPFDVAVALAPPSAGHRTTLTARYGEVADQVTTYTTYRWVGDYTPPEPQTFLGGLERPRRRWSRDTLRSPR